MNIIFYNNLSEKNRLNKSIVEPVEVIGELTEGCNILNPSIKFDKISQLFTKNYCYIPAFNRYYFVEDIEVNNKNIIISLHVDVLMSFRQDISNSSALITRSNYGNKYLKDSLAVSTNKPIIQYRNLGTCFTSGAHYVMVKGGN